MVWAEISEIYNSGEHRAGWRLRHEEGKTSSGGRSFPHAARAAVTLSRSDREEMKLADANDHA